MKQQAGTWLILSLIALFVTGICFSHALNVVKLGDYAEQGFEELMGWVFAKAFFDWMMGALAVSVFLFLLMILFKRISGTWVRAWIAFSAFAGGIALMLLVADWLMFRASDPSNLPFFAETREDFRVYLLSAFKTKLGAIASGEIKVGGILVITMLATLGLLYGWLVQLLAGRIFHLKKSQDLFIQHRKTENKALYPTLLIAVVIVGICIFVNSKDSITTFSSSSQKPSVVLVSIDTLRADSLGCYGNSEGLTPHLDKLAEKGTRFENAIAPSPWTLPSHASFFSGKSPSLVGVTGVANRLPEKVITLTEAFKASGYRTGGFVSHLFVSESYGFAQGFDHFQYVSTETAQDVVTHSIDWIKNAEGDGYFAFVHLFDPHWPYSPPGEVLPVPEGPHAETIQNLSETKDFYDFTVGVLDAEPEVLDYFRHAYRQEIGYVDRWIGKLLEQIDLVKTIVIVTSDHGEEFLDHGFLGHSITLYNEVLHVPLIIAGGSIPEGMVVETPVSLTGLYGEIAELTKIKVPSGIAAGFGDEQPARQVLSETALGGENRFAIQKKGWNSLKPTKLPTEIFL